MLRVIFFLVILFSCNGDITLDETSNLIEEIPEKFVREDDQRLVLRAGIYYYQDSKFSGHLIQGSKKRNKLDYSYFDGLQHGLQRGWHSDGKLSFEYNCRLGKRIGIYKEYYPSGKLQIERYYENGVEKKNKILDPYGNVIANYTFKDGKLYGLVGSSSCISVIEKE